MCFTLFNKLFTRQLPAKRPQFCGQKAIYLEFFLILLFENSVIFCSYNLIDQDHPYIHLDSKLHTIRHISANLSSSAIINTYRNVKDLNK